MPHRVFGPMASVCPECGAFVGKARRHRKWHKKNKMAKPVKATPQERMLGP